MYCGKCGTQNSDDARFCKACGAPLSSPVKQEEPAGGKTTVWEVAEPEKTVEVQNENLIETFGDDDNKPKKSVVIIVVVLAVALVACILLFGKMLGKDKDQDELDEEPEQIEEIDEEWDEDEIEATIDDEEASKDFSNYASLGDALNAYETLPIEVCSLFYLDDDPIPEIFYIEAGTYHEYIASYHNGKITHFQNVRFENVYEKYCPGQNLMFYEDFMAVDNIEIYEDYYYSLVDGEFVQVAKERHRTYNPDSYEIDGKEVDLDKFETFVNRGRWDELPTPEYFQSVYEAYGYYFGNEPEYDEAYNDPGYIILGSDSRYVAEDQLWEIKNDAWRLRLARNEIYARHGYIFKDEEVLTYFMDKPWYYPEVSPEDFDESVFNDYEKKNILLIKDMESRIE